MCKITGSYDIRNDCLKKESSSPDIFTKTLGQRTCSILYSGEIYNKTELMNDLHQKGCLFSGSSDEEVVLTGFFHSGPSFVKKLNGIFAFAVADSETKSLYLFRDRIGAKPLFYTKTDSMIFFSSRLKHLFAHEAIKPVIDRNGLNEIFSIGPARTPGCGVFKGIFEILPGTWRQFSPSGSYETTYWKPESHPHTDSYETTVEKTAELIYDAVKRQMEAPEPVCTFLSGGVDSSLVSAICAMEMKKQGRRLTTYSFDFTDNQKYFVTNSFQPSLDRPYVDIMVKFLDSDHHYLECGNEDQLNLLTDSVLAHDLPAMADIDSSMLYFCSLVAKEQSVTLTGECADEIFGGYPWFHKEECLNAETFPWTMDLSFRKQLLNKDFLDFLQMEQHIKNSWETTIRQTPACPDDTPEEAKRRRISWLNLKWFMQTLLNRMERTSAYSGLSARVPFADHRIIEYLWNVPWEMKTRDGVVKSLLRQSGAGLLPNEILFRKKSPYPKTYDTRYEIMLGERLKTILADSSSPLHNFLEKEKVAAFLNSPSDYGKPWYGQLMAGPQMIAYLIQIHLWMTIYGVQVESF